MKNLGCPVCGYSQMTAFDKFGEATYEICDCCGNESGYEYSKITSKKDFEKLRDCWLLENKNKFWSGKHQKTGILLNR